MRHCLQCGSSYIPKNNEQIYCSSACKSKASRERRKSNLSDWNNQSFTQIPVTSSIVSEMANTAVKGAMGQFNVPSITEVVKTLKDPAMSKNSKIMLVGGGVAGGIVGYQFADNGQKLGGTILGVALGICGGKIIHWLFQDEEVVPETTTSTTLSDASLRLYTAEEISKMQILTVSFTEDTTFGRLVGKTFNEKFSILLFGEAGGGKSHIATKMASELAQYGKVLYVLAEEDVTDSVRTRIKRYVCDGVKFFVSNKEEKILELAREYDFLILDSLNGMSQWNYHTDFLRKVKALNLRGTILVNQVNKQGDFVGNNSLLHEVDVSIKVTDGIAETTKNRFGTSENTLAIFDKTPIARKII